MYSVLYQLVMGAYQSSKLFEGDGLGWLAHPKNKKFEKFALFHNKSFQTLHTPKQGLFKGFCDFVMTMKSHFSGQTYGKNWPIKKNTAPKLGYYWYILPAWPTYVGQHRRTLCKECGIKPGVINNNIQGCMGTMGTQ